jgi:transcriptional regulator with XRE-family HTH domain
MSRYALCRLTGLDKAVMSRFMSGKSFMSEDSLNRLARALKLKVVAGVKLPGKDG